MKTEPTIQPGQVNLGYQKLVSNDVKGVLIALSSEPPTRQERPRKCRRLDGVPLILNRIKAVSQASPVKSLSFSGNPIGDGAMKHIYMIPESITDLDLSECRLTPKGVRTLSEFLKTNESITRLTLRGNHVGLAGAKAIAEMLLLNKTLRVLSVSDCKIGPGGFAYIGMGILKNESLKELDLSRQKDFSILNDEYVESFGEMSSIITFDGDFCVLTLAVCLNSRLGLEKLDVSDLGTSDRSADAMAKYLENNETLEEIQLGVNKSVSLDYGKPWSVVCHQLAMNRLKRNLIDKPGLDDSKWMEYLVQSSGADLGLHGLYFILKNKPDLCNRQKLLKE